jgi:uncharacterized protein
MSFSGVDAFSLDPLILEGELIHLDPLSFWGGVDPVTGCIIDHHHPDFGLCISQKIIYMPRARGSSSSSSVLAECIRLGTAPTAIVLDEPDPIILVGALVAEELYGLKMLVLLSLSCKS